MDRLRHPKASDRKIDEEAIEGLLRSRDEAKTAKNYPLADEIASTLRSQGICYEDDVKTYYARTMASTTSASTEDTSKTTVVEVETQNKSSVLRSAKKPSLPLPSSSEMAQRRLKGKKAAKSSKKLMRKIV